MKLFFVDIIAAHEGKWKVVMWCARVEMKRKYDVWVGRIVNAHNWHPSI